MSAFKPKPFASVDRAVLSFDPIDIQCPGEDRHSSLGGPLHVSAISLALTKAAEATTSIISSFDEKLDHAKQNLSGQSHHKLQEESKTSTGRPGTDLYTRHRLHL